MTLDEIVALARAGYTKAEIAALTAAPKEPAKAQPAKPAEPAKPTEPATPAKEEPAKAADPAPAADPFAAFNEAAEKALAAFSEKLDKLTTLAGMPSIGSVEPKGIEDIISGFLKEV